MLPWGYVAVSQAKFISCVPFQWKKQTMIRALLSWRVFCMALDSLRSGFRSFSADSSSHLVYNYIKRSTFSIMQGELQIPHTWGPLMTTSRWVAEMSTWTRSSVQFFASTATSTLDCVWKNWCLYRGSDELGSAVAPCTELNGGNLIYAMCFGQLFMCWVVIVDQASWNWGS